MSLRDMQPDVLADLQSFVSQFEHRPMDLGQVCFREQLAFAQDPAPFATAVCSRRAGKSTACAADLLATAQAHPGTVCLYITLSHAQAKRVFWPILKAFNDAYLCRGTANEADLSLRLPNGSIIYCSGAANPSAVEKFLGMPLVKVYIDEGQSFRSFLHDLIDRVLAPALLDYAGKIRLIGTPGLVPSGPFWDLTQHPEWTHHKWTFFDNPHIEKKSGMPHMALLERELKRSGMALGDPRIRREYFGEWVTDEGSRVLQYSPTRNHYTNLPDLRPTDSWSYILGIDIGFHDSDALAVLAYCDNSPDTYLVHEVCTAKQGITELVNAIQLIQKTYPISKMVMDTGGLGKKIAEELIRQKSLPIEAADKMRKFENLALLNDALRTGRLRAKSASLFAEDSYKVEWDHAKSKPDRKVVSDRYHSDIIDAVLYAFKCSPAFAWTPEAPAIVRGSKEWVAKEENDMFEQALERAKEQQDREREGW